MSKHNIHNRDHYTIAGRERPGKNVVHDSKNHVSRKKEKQNSPEGSRNFIPGAAPVGQRGDE